MQVLVGTFNQEKALVRENRWIICSSSLATATAGDKLEEFSGTGARPEDGGIMAGERNIENPEADRHHDR